MALYIIPVPIYENDINSIPQSNIEKLHDLKYFIVERARSARRYIKNTGFKGNLDDLVFIELDKHSNTKIDKSILNPAIEGNDMGLMSESGMPCIADPGSKIVNIAHKLGIKVIPLVGPSSVFLALAASGLNGQSFKFEGYLPIKSDQLITLIKKIERNILVSNTTHIFIETPYRNEALFEKLIRSLSDNIKLCMAVELNSPAELILTRKISDWKVNSNIEIKKKNCIFLIGS